MGVLSRWVEQAGDGGYFLFCPACQQPHMVPTGAGAGPRWGFNGDEAKPTFTPSLLLRGKRPITDDEADRIFAGEKLDIPQRVCHSFVTDGQIQFLGDCTHALAGQTVPLPEYPKDWE
ncbi:MAG: DUF6527 family protein [Caulobacter sp.]|nr:DUF6527 family protein [Caulobacter sp.]